MPKANGKDSKAEARAKILKKLGKCKKHKDYAVEKEPKDKTCFHCEGLWRAYKFLVGA